MAEASHRLPPVCRMIGERLLTWCRQTRRASACLYSVLCTCLRPAPLGGQKKDPERGPSLAATITIARRAASRNIDHHRVRCTGDHTESVRCASSSTSLQLRCSTRSDVPQRALCISRIAAVVDPADDATNSAYASTTG